MQIWVWVLAHVMLRFVSLANTLQVSRDSCHATKEVWGDCLRNVVHAYVMWYMLTYVFHSICSARRVCLASEMRRCLAWNKFPVKVLRCVGLAGCRRGCISCC